MTRLHMMIEDISDFRFADSGALLSCPTLGHSKSVNQWEAAQVVGMCLTVWWHEMANTQEALVVTIRMHTGT